MSKANIITIVIIIAILIVAGWFAWQAQQKKQSSDESEAGQSLVGSSENEVVYTDLDGNPVDLEQYNNQIRVVNSWATWCPFCVNELKEFEELARNNQSDTVVIAINRKEPVATQRTFLRQLGEFEHIVFVQDGTDYFYDSIGGFAMPETVYYDTSGTVAVHKRGFMALDEMERHLNAARTNTEE